VSVIAHGRSRALAAAWAAFGLALGADARAADGVLEINQTCAAGAGCFTGDTPGFPVQITGAAGRSYALTSDLFVADIDTRAILASGTIRGITIDLGGFTIQGPVTCVGQPASCTANGIGSGIQALGPTLSGVTVRNGTIRGMGGNGVALSDDCVVQQVNLVENADSGASGGIGCRIEDVSAVRNGAGGIGVTQRSFLRRVVARANGTVGIFASAGSEVQESVAVDNGGDGIACQSGCSVQTATSRDNGGFARRRYCR